MEILEGCWGEGFSYQFIWGKEETRGKSGAKVSDSALKRVEVDFGTGLLLRCVTCELGSLWALPFIQMTQMGWCFAPDTSHVFVSDVTRAGR